MNDVAGQIAQEEIDGQALAGQSFVEDVPPGIVAVTATPYAAASAVDSWNATTRPIELSISNQFTDGM